MKIFERDGKINFVDDNNVLVGFDYSQCCCENFGYALTREIPAGEAESDKPEIDPDGYQFDRDFFQEGSPESQWDEGGRVTFRLEKEGASLFLTLYNSHNGYYGHGFEMTCGNERLHDGTL